MKTHTGRIYFVIGIVWFVCLSVIVNFAHAKNQACIGNHDKIAKTQYGLVKGFFDEHNTCCWKGIPFAKPPVGELRWKAPQNPEPWNGKLKTTEFSDICPQYSENATKIIGNEDCLYLNVWRPRGKFDKPLPVYFWIHGGGNSVGSACEARYVGAKLANKGNMIVVTTNYRLGPFGWFTHPALRNGNEIDDSGNYGTLDLIKSLEWVQNNISSFGGDPDRVTIAGVSAGGQNVLSLMISPLAKGLFHRAIAASSGMGGTTVEDGELASEEAVGRLLVKDGLDQAPEDIAQYLKSKTPSELLLVYDTMIIYSLLNNFKRVFFDGTVLQSNGISALQDSSTCNQVPIILGNTEEEHKFFMMWDDWDNVDAAAYQIQAEKVTSSYWWYSVDNVAYALLLNPDQPNVYKYRFKYGTYRYDENFQPDLSKYNAWPTTESYNYALMLGASHGMDIPFFWGNFLVFYGYESFLFREDNREGQEALSDTCIEYISNFVHNGDPYSESLPVWENWSAFEEPKYLNLDANDTDAIIYMSYE